MINDQRMKQENTWETTNAYTYNQDHVGNVENSTQKSKEESQLFIEECRSLAEEVRNLIANLGQMSTGILSLFLARIAASSVIIAIFSLLITLTQPIQIPQIVFNIILIVFFAPIINICIQMIVELNRLKPHVEWKPSMIALRKLLMNRRDVIKNCCREICSQKTNSKNLMLCEDLKVLSDTLNEILTDKRVLKSILESLKNLLMGKRFRS